MAVPVAPPLSQGIAEELDNPRYLFGPVTRKLMDGRSITRFLGVLSKFIQMSQLRAPPLSRPLALVRLRETVSLMDHEE